MHPTDVVSWFNVNLTLLLFAIGVVWKFVPAFKNISNAVIPWLNALVALLPGLIHLLTPPAQAAVSPAVAQATIGIGDVIFRAFVHSAAATVCWEAFGKNLLQGLLGLKPPAPAQ